MQSLTQWHFFFVETEKTILKSTWNLKAAPNRKKKKKMLKKNKVWSLKFPGF